MHRLQKMMNTEVKMQLRVEVDILQRAMKRKLNLFGHVCLMKGARLIKRVIFCIVEGTNRRGRHS